MLFDEIYDFLEKNVSLYKFYSLHSEITKICKNYSVSNKEQELIDVEFAIFGIADNFNLEREKWMDKAYKIIDKHLDYVANRAENSKNSLLKAVYSEILFYSANKKYKKYVNMAADFYLEAVKIFHGNLKKIPNDFYQLNNLIDKTLHLFLCANKDTHPIKKEIKQIIATCKKSGQEYIFIIPLIIELMLKYKKIFKKADYKGIDDIFWECIKKKIKNKEYQYVINVIDLGKKIDEKTGKLSYPWVEEKCKCYEKLIKKEKNPIVACGHCINAIQAYNSMDVISKRKQNIEILYSSLKDKIILPTHHYKTEISGFIEYADDILKLTPPEIYRYLATSKQLFPAKNILEKNEGFLSSLFTSVYLDYNSHPAKISNNELLNDRYLSNYRSVWQLCEKTIHRIFFKGIETKKLNLQNTIAYLFKHSQMFDLQTKKIGGKKIKYNWSSSIIRIFETYFNEAELFIKNSEIHYPHLIEITDSLVLRFEAFLRLFLENYKQPSITTSNEQDIVREKDINLLLYDKFIISKLTFEDLLYFRYLFVAKEGQNLRNNVAHSLLIPEQYTFELFNLVFFAFLRLSKYDISNSLRKKS